MKDSIDSVHEDIVTFGREVEKESEDLDYIINKIETSVDFVASQVRETIHQWKDLKVYHRNSLEDLKRKFRLDTFSIEDGWGIYYLYPARIRDMRSKLLRFIGRMGTDPRPFEPVLSAMERAEQGEWSRDLDMDMGVIFALQEIKRIHAVTDYMERRLNSLEHACKRRSEQITAPEWEPRGLL